MGGRGEGRAGAARHTPKGGRKAKEDGYKGGRQREEASVLMGVRRGKDRGARERGPCRGNGVIVYERIEPERRLRNMIEMGGDEGATARGHLERR